MRNFWEKIKGFFVWIWTFVKTFFSNIWTGLSTAGRILLGLILIALIGLVAYATYDGKDNNKEESNSPEVAQVFEPSIGTPIPPDQPSRPSGEVGGATTTEPSASEPAPAPATTFEAPKSGVDPSEPVDYKNDALKFAAVLSPGTQVIEQNDEIEFITNYGALQYLVSVNDSGNETLASIESQLRNSPTASNISYTNISNQKAISFNAKGYGTGIAFIANGKIYYLLGNNQYFSTFKVM
jgi:hypothetical protein